MDGAWRGVVMLKRVAQRAFTRALRAKPKVEPVSDIKYELRNLSTTPRGHVSPASKG